jgi:hypothetical protein
VTRELVAFARAAGDGVAIGDQATAGSPPLQRSAADTFTVADTAARGLLSWTRAGVEAWTIADEASRAAASSARLALDVVTIGDAADGRVTLGRQAGDVVEVFDAAVIFVAAVAPHYGVVLGDLPPSPLTIGTPRPRRQLVPHAGEAEVQTLPRHRPARTVVPR